MGGDCLHYGCVPSKALIAAAAAADGIRHAGRFGVNGHDPAVDFLGLREHLRGVIAAIAPHDSVERFEGLGVTVIQAAARFTAPRELVAGETRSEEHTSELQSLMRISYAVFCLKKKKHKYTDVQQPTSTILPHI